MKRDTGLIEAIYSVTVALNQLNVEIGDTLVAVGSDAYTTALQIYRYVKAQDEGIGPNACVDDMGMISYSPVTCGMSVLLLSLEALLLSRLD